MRSRLRFFVASAIMLQAPWLTPRTSIVLCAVWTMLLVGVAWFIWPMPHRRWFAAVWLLAYGAWSASTYFA